MKKQLVAFGEVQFDNNLLIYIVRNFNYILFYSALVISAILTAFKHKFD